jgi:hypothetical protein
MSKFGNGNGNVQKKKDQLCDIFKKILVKLLLHTSDEFRFLFQH